MNFRFFNKPVNYRQFDYSPMYYDERKERLELKKKEFEKMNDERLTADERKSILRNNIQEGWSHARHNGSNRSSAIRVLILIALIVALGYFVFYGLDEIDQVIHKIW